MMGSLTLNTHSSVGDCGLDLCFPLLKRALASMRHSWQVEMAQHGSAYKVRPYDQACQCHNTAYETLYAPT
jgi:hypothetical protein